MLFRGTTSFHQKDLVRSRQPEPACRITDCAVSVYWPGAFFDRPPGDFNRASSGGFQPLTAFSVCFRGLLLQAFHFPRLIIMRFTVHVKQRASFLIIPDAQM
jgi:hypothetical protein